MNANWEIKLEVKFEKNWVGRKASPLEQNQKYYRFMERYSTSLDTCKHLHHQILVTNDEQRVIDKKSGKKANDEQKVNDKKKAAKETTEKKMSQLIIENNEKEKLKKQQTKENNFFSLLEKCFEISKLNEQLRMVDLKQYSANFMFSLLQLKLKLYKNDSLSAPSENERKAHMYLIIKELFENYTEHLTKR